MSDEDFCRCWFSDNTLPDGRCRKCGKKPDLKEKTVSGEIDKGAALEKLVSVTADNLKARYGEEAAIIIMIAIPEEGGHHIKRWSWRGRCLTVEGLLHRGAVEIMGSLSGGPKT